MARKIIEWSAENNKQRVQTAFTFLRAGLQMLRNKKTSIRVSLTNIKDDNSAILYDRNRG